MNMPSAASINRKTTGNMSPARLGVAGADCLNGIRIYMEGRSGETVSCVGFWSGRSNVRRGTCVSRGEAISGRRKGTGDRCGGRPG